MKIKPDALIFDLDGTLWDSTTQVTTAWNSAMKHYGKWGKFFSREQIASTMGKPADEIFRMLFPEAPPEERKELAKKLFGAEIDEMTRSPVNLYPGVAEGIPKLASKYPLAVVSNCEIDYLEMFFKSSGIGSFFKDGECYGRTLKTKGENITDVAKRNKFSDAIYIGDTESDEQAAYDARIPFFHAAYGFGKSKNAVARFARFNECVNYFIS